MLEDLSIQERYAVAATSDSLQPGADLDVLIAAALASGMDRRRATALELERMRATGERAAIPGLLHELAGWLAHRQARGHGRPAPRSQREAASLTVLGWWFAPACTACGGLGFRRLTQAPALSAQACHACGGAGRPGLPNEDDGDARWLAAEIERLAAAALADMARRMRYGRAPITA